MTQNQFEHRAYVEKGTLWDAFLEEDASSLADEHATFEQISLRPNSMKINDDPIVLVTDADAVFTELSYLKRGVDKPSAYKEMSLSGVCVHHSPDWIKTELETSVIPSFSKHYGIHQSEVIDWIESHVLPLIEIHDGYSDLSIYNVSSRHDRKDAPYVALALDISASAIISNNKKDFQQYGVRSLLKEDLSELLFMARCQHAAAMTRTYGHFGGRVAVGATEGILKGAVKGFKALPPVGKGLVVGAGAIGLYLWLNRPEGREQAKWLLRQAGFGSVEIGKFVGEGAVKIKEWDRRSSNIRENYAPENRDLT